MYLLNKTSKSLNNLFNTVSKIFKNINTNVWILTFIISTIVLLFILSNTLEYNTNTFNNNTNKEGFETYNLMYYELNFKGNYTINYNNTVYYDENDNELLLENITLYFNKSNFSEGNNTIDGTTTTDEDNIPSIEDLQNMTLVLYDELDNATNINFDKENITFTENEKYYTIPINQNIHLTDNITLTDANKKYYLVITVDNEEYYLEFNVGKKNFRFNKDFLKSGDTRLDTLSLKKYDVNRNIVLDELNYVNNKFSLDEFNKLTFIINKPNQNKLIDTVSRYYINNNIDNFKDKIDEFKKYIPTKFNFNITKITNNNRVGINPKFILPRGGALCIDENDTGFTNNNDNACKLTLLNLLPNEKYNIKMELIYTKLDEPSNIRRSALYNQNFEITSIEDNVNKDILLQTVSSAKKFDFSNKLMQKFNILNNFNEEQKIQNNKLRTIETNLANKLQNFDY